MTFRLILALLALVLWAPQALSQGDPYVPTNRPGAVPNCTVAELQVGTCQLALPGFTAWITDGDATDTDMCDDTATGLSSARVRCEYRDDITQWKEMASGGGGGIPDAPVDGLSYKREDGAWVLGTQMTFVSTQAEMQACLDDYVETSGTAVAACGLSVPVLEVTTGLTLLTGGTPAAGVTTNTLIDCGGGTINWTDTTPDAGQLFYITTGGRGSGGNKPWNTYIRNCHLTYKGGTLSTTGAMIRLYNQEESKGCKITLVDSSLDGGSLIPFGVYRESFTTPGVGEGFSHTYVDSILSNHWDTHIRDKKGAVTDSGGRTIITGTLFNLGGRCMNFTGGSEVRLRGNTYFRCRGFFTDSRTFWVQDDVMAIHADDGDGVFNFDSLGSNIDADAGGLFGSFNITETIGNNALIVGNYLTRVDATLIPMENSCGNSIFADSPGVIDIDYANITSWGDQPPVSGDFGAHSTELDREWLGTVRLRIDSPCPLTDWDETPWLSPRTYQALNKTTFTLAEGRSLVDITYSQRGEELSRFQIRRDGLPIEKLFNADTDVVCETFDQDALQAGAVIRQPSPTGLYLNTLECFTTATEVSNLDVGGLTIPSCAEAVTGEVITQASCENNEDCIHTAASTPVVPGTIRVTSGADSIFDDYRGTLVGDSVNRNAEGTITGEAQTGSCTDCTGSLDMEPVQLSGVPTTTVTDGTLNATWDGLSWVGADINSGTSYDDTLSGTHVTTGLIFATLPNAPINTAEPIIVDRITDADSGTLTYNGTGNSWEGDGIWQDMGVCLIIASTGSLGPCVVTTGTSPQDVRFRYNGGTANSFASDGDYEIPWVSAAAATLNFSYSWIVTNLVDYVTGALQFAPASAVAGNLDLGYSTGSGVVQPADDESVYIEPWTPVTIASIGTETGSGNTTVCVGVSE